MPVTHLITVRDHVMAMILFSLVMVVSEWKTGFRWVPITVLAAVLAEIHEHHTHLISAEGVAAPVN